MICVCIVQRSIENERENTHNNNEWYEQVSNTGE